MLMFCINIWRRGNKAGPEQHPVFKTLMSFLTPTCSGTQEGGHIGSYVASFIYAGHEQLLSAPQHSADREDLLHPSETACKLGPTKEVFPVKILGKEGESKSSHCYCACLCSITICMAQPPAASCSICGTRKAGLGICGALLMVCKAELLSGILYNALYLLNKEGCSIH